MLRQIVLDTETTGLRVEEGHRIIEIGCLEMINRKLTGKQFHYYFNPGRTIETDAVSIHGITNEFLQDKPLFAGIANELINFILDAELIIHNAPFDLSFLDHELALTGYGFKPITDYCRVIDTLQMARQLYVGQRNNLDALCKRHGIDHSKRNFHGALVDTYLLAQVYLAMTGGQGNFFDTLSDNQTTISKGKKTRSASSKEQHQLTLLKANTDELFAHKQYLAHMQQQGKCLWPSNDTE